METELWDFGEIRGCMCSYYLYGIALDKDGNPVFCRKNAKKNRFGDNAKTIFEGVRNEIKAIYQASRDVDDAAVDKSPLSGVFAGKLSYLFNPDHWIPIYGEDDLSALCNAFGLQTSCSRTTLRRQLYNFMLSLGIDDITPYLFMRFCYNKMGYLDAMRPRHVGSHIEADDPVSFRHYKAIETAETLAEKKRTGTEGERKVLKYLEDNRSKLGIIGKIDAPCLRGEDGCHYDFKYKTEEGEHYVEAKATKCDLTSPVFHMSKHEYDFMVKNREHYTLFFVNNVYDEYSIIQVSGDEIKEHLGPASYFFPIR